MAFDPAKQRKIMGHFATGVTVVTTGGKAGTHGLTANAVASLSLDPPLVLVAVEKKAHTLDFLKANRCFAVNILRLEQEDDLATVRHARAQGLHRSGPPGRRDRVPDPGRLPGLCRLPGRRDPARRGS